MKKNTINQLFREACKNYANNVAVKFKDEIITYKELDIISSQKANFLIEQGVKKEDFVGVIFDHNIELITNILAIIKAGAAYIPMEPAFPVERINYILETSPAKFVMVQEKYKSIIKNKDLILPNNIDLTEYSSDFPTNVNDENNALYVLYTSGTTGVPKGVIIEHKNVYNYVKAFKKEFHITQKDKMLQNSVVTFDIFTEEIFPILSCGGQLIILPQDQRDDAKQILKVIEREEISYISVFPYLVEDINDLIKKGKMLPNSLKVIISGGDVLRKEYCSNLIPQVKVYNTYGPTETTVVCSYYNYTNENYDSKTVPIGKSIYGTDMIVLNEKREKVNPGEIGEICITGNGVGRGYLNSPKETKKRFVDNPFNDNEKMYLSGDLGLLNKDGNIEFIKRKDEQVMIKGKRVEPMEVENLLYKISGINTAIIKAYQDEKKNFYLVGYLKLNEDIKMEQIKSYLYEYVPEYMVPEYWVKIDDFKKTYNGKIDRKALPVVLK